MIKKNCDCGCSIFYVNKRTMIIECGLCKQKFKMNKGNNWVKVIKKKKLFFIPTRETIKDYTYKKLETIGEFRKRLKIKKIKKKKLKATKEEVKLVKEYEKQKQIELKQLKKLWKNEIDFLLNEKIISFNKNEHKGKLRGKHIAKKFYSDLKKLGIKARLYFRKDKAFVELM